MISLASVLFLLPRNIVLIILRVYRALISPLYGEVCRFYPSCSAYALTAVQRRGVLIGSALSVRRLVRCNPWSHGGVDDVPPVRNAKTTPFGFVMTASQRKN